LTHAFSCAIMIRLYERKGCAMEKRVELNRLLDFYGGLLTDHRREIMKMYLEEDLSLQEVADNMNITRQGVHDAIAKAQKQLEEYEAKLGLMKRYQFLQRALTECETALQEKTEDAFEKALKLIKEIRNSER